MVNLPVVLIVVKMEQRAADINAGGSFHGYRYNKKYIKVKYYCLPNVYEKLFIIQYTNIY